ncbi:MAG TPA: alpha-galactosidase, partial [Phycisphaerae bacterium]|nr:alpha-galactosidase [Phycisphaerae bacterium]
ATQLVLQVADGGDGIACDQADWADATVTLADGRELPLGQLPLTGLYEREWPAEPPFSFFYDGRPSTELLPRWEKQRSSRELDSARIEHTVTYTGGNLQVRWVAIEYRDFPTVEWTLYFRNTGQTDTPILERIQALDLPLRRGPSGEFVLHHNVGSPCQPFDYQPLVSVLSSGTSKRISAAGGRPTNTDLPYFNVIWPGDGLIAVVGWPGQWAATFERDYTQSLRIRAGQELTHLKLLPGEEIRTPLVVLQFHKGERLRSQNVWRRWMLAHNYPRPGGKLPGVHLAACSSHQYAEMINADTASQIMFIDRYLAEGLPLDYWWMDAGWYINTSGWPNTGTWEVDQKRFPGGLRPICDHAHTKGVRTIVWFEPERVTPGTWLYENHPEWLLGKDGEQKLLNLGDARARQWLTDHVDRLLREEGIDLYRQDHNFDPLAYWRANDEPDRAGITEIRHVEGYLAYWDELRRRHPNLLIDSCASGGRRNDLETLRRAIPLLRSDYIIEPVGNQCHTYGIAFWMPYHGTGSSATDLYQLRSVLCPQFNACFDMRRTDLDYDLLRRVFKQWRQFAEYYFGDYYPLTSYSLENDVWMAWQFNVPEKCEGLVQCFRRADSPYESARFRLRGLDPAAQYELTDVDSDSPLRMSGRTLLDEGLPVTATTRPAAVVITYRRVGESEP